MKKLPSSRFKLADYKRNEFRVSPEHGTTLEDIQKPEFWSHVAAHLASFDTIEVIPEDGSFYAELLVITAGKQFATVKLLRHVDLEGKAAKKDAPEAQIHPDYKIEWGGVAVKHRVVRSDGEVMAEGIQKKADAEAWLQDFLTKQAA